MRIPIESNTLMPTDTPLIFTASERRVLKALIDGKEHRWKQLLQTSGVSRRSLAESLKSLIRKELVQRREVQGREYPRPILYRLEDGAGSLVKQQLEYEPDLEWSDQLSPLVEEAETQKLTDSDRFLKMRNLARIYHTGELLLLERQIMWAAYCRLRGDKFLEKLLARAAKRNFAKYAEHLLATIHRNPVLAYAILTQLARSTKLEREVFTDMFLDDLSRVDICEEAAPNKTLAKGQLNWRPSWHFDPSSLQLKKEREFREAFARITQTAEYLASGDLHYDDLWLGGSSHESNEETKP